MERASAAQRTVDKRGMGSAQEGNIVPSPRDNLPLRASPAAFRVRTSAAACCCWHCTFSCSTCHSITRNLSVACARRSRSAASHEVVAGLLQCAPNYAGCMSQLL